MFQAIYLSIALLLFQLLMLIKPLRELVKKYETRS